jgi:DMSO/TMAO reductase YedYZ molybdopterin-dependent catalytic subunit
MLIAPAREVSASTEWNLRVSNSSTVVYYSYEQLLAMPVTTVNANLACYGSPVANGDWSGVSLSYLLDQSGLDQTTVSVTFGASDGYVVSLSLDEALRSDVIIAYQLNGVPLTETLRLVMPLFNGNMWIAMITSITMSSSAVQPSSGNDVKVPKISILPPWSPSQAQTQNISPKNETIIEPTVPSMMPSTVPSTTPSTNSTQTNQSTSVKQESNLKGIGFPVEAVYGIAIGATAVLLVATVSLIRKRISNKFSSSHDPIE